MKFKLFHLLVLLLLLTGCGGPDFKVVEVTGTVTQDGKPLNEVKIMFLPDPANLPPEDLEQGRGQLSQAITDEEGKYRLKYRGDSHEYGAEEGKHRITAIDVLAENSRDNPIPPRISQKYAIASETDISYEVAPKDPEEPLVFNFELNEK